MNYLDEFEKFIKQHSNIKFTFEYDEKGFTHWPTNGQFRIIMSKPIKERNKSKIGWSGRSLDECMHNAIYDVD